MADEQGMTAATCRTCGRRLTIEEFRACTGVGHYCAAHLPPPSASKTRSGPIRRAGTAPSVGNRRGRRVSESGVIEYACRGQFARNGVTRPGRLTTDHPSSIAGGAVFVCNNVGYGPAEIATLFIKDPEGRALAERHGFHCQG